MFFKRVVSRVVDFLLPRLFSRVCKCMGNDGGNDIKCNIADL